MKKLFFFFLWWTFSFSCTNDSTKVNNEGFEDYLSSFTFIELPMKIDSEQIKKFKTKVKPKLNDSQLKFVGFPESKELYEGNMKFFFYPEFKFKLNENWGLIYFSTLNPEVPFDASISKVWLETYNKEGKVISSQQVGLIDLQFGIEKRVFSTIYKDSILLTSKTSVENFESGKINEQLTSKKAVINNGEIFLDKEF